MSPTKPPEERQDEFEERPDLVKQRARADMFQKLTKGALIFLFVIAMCALLFNSYNGVQGRRELLDCTVPDGECYQRSQQASAAAIQQLIDANAASEAETRRIIVLAVACVESLNARTVSQIQTCIERGLEARNDGRSD